MTGLIVHEWIERTGGAEKVLDGMRATFPTAEIRCLWNDAPERFPDKMPAESWLARTPLRGKKALALGLMPSAWRNIRLDKTVDWLLVSSHLFAHHASLAAPNNEVPKFVYAHTPARYIWEPDLDERGKSLVPRLVSPFLRSYDRSRAAEITYVAANSEFVKRRISSTWGLDATVIYPPVDVTRIQSINDWSAELSSPDERILGNLPYDFLLGASRFVRYKQLDRVIDLGERAGVPVVIAGSGPDRARLLTRAAVSSVPVSFVDAPSDALLYAIYQRALAYVFPGIEDFGIMPVEAMATGVPVIVGRVGGAAESVVDGLTGVHLDFEDDAAYKDALSTTTTLNREDCMQRAREFSTVAFQSNLRRWMEQL